MRKGGRSPFLALWYISEEEEAIWTCIHTGWGGKGREGKGRRTWKFKVDSTVGDDSDIENDSDLVLGIEL